MSRWDSLKPEKVPKGSARWSQKPERGGKLQPQKKTEDSLMISYAHFVEQLNLCALIRVDFSNSQQLSIDGFSAEKIAEIVVKDSLVPALSNRDSPEKLLQAACNLCHELFSNPKTCSAIIAPLTADIDQGEESVVANPIGMSLILAIQDRLPQSTLTFTKLLYEIHQRSIADTIAPSMHSLLVFFRNELKQDVTSPTLELLRSVLVTYSSSYKTLKTLLLRKYNSKSLCANCCECCAYIQGTSILLDLFHSKKYTSLVCSCIIAFLNSFPLHIWLDEKSIGSMRLFAQSLKEDIISLIRSIICCFSFDDDLLKLVYVVLSKIPYSDAAHDGLTKEAVKMVEKLVSMVKTEWRENLITCFCDCAGGRPQPNGEISPMVLPMRLWLSDQSSSAFKTFLVESATQKESCSLAIRLIGAIVRTRADFICLLDLKTIVLDNTQKDGMKLVVDFLIGRKECSLECMSNTSASSKFVVTHLNTVMRTSKGSEARHLCLQGYCLLLPVDWAFLIKAGQTPTCLDNLKKSIKQGNNKEKSISFKAIGEMLMRCFTDVDSDICTVGWLTQLCSELEPILEIGLDDSCTPAVAVRSMALFAAGNLAFAVRQRQSENKFVRAVFLNILMEKVCSCIDHSNEKIVGNAIRSIGHIGFLAFHHPDFLTLEPNDHPVQLFLLIIGKLCQKIYQASDCSTISSMTWKERSSAKKHGWGACHALGHVLCCSVATEPHILTKSQTACAAIVSCIKQYESLNEKIIIAAGGALRRIDLSRLELLCHRSGILGTALSSCLNIKLNKKRNVRLQAEVDSIMNHILPIITVLDAEVIIREEATSSSLLWLLYEWMVENLSSGSPFEIFAIALEQAKNLDIRLEQNFASRASCLHRTMLTRKNDQFHDDEI